MPSSSSLPAPNFMKWVGQAAGYSPRLKPVRPSVYRSCGCCFLFCPSSVLFLRALFCHGGERYP